MLANTIHEGKPIRGKREQPPPAVATRDVFRIPRDHEFFTADELAKQIGHDPEDWPVALLSELISNGLDAAEARGVAPVIHVEITDDAFSVTDNGPGIPWDVVEGSRDYNTRTTDKAYYISPTRGRQGNALKTLWAAPFVAGWPAGVEVEADGKKSTLFVERDRIGDFAVKMTDYQPSDVKTGSKFTVTGGKEACLLDVAEPSDFYNGGIEDTDIEFGMTSASTLVKSFALFNPHTAFHFDTTDECTHFPASKTDWKKWLPSDHPPHWYTSDSFGNLMSACLRADLERGHARHVREFVKKFRGLSGSAKQRSVCEAAGIAPGATIEAIADNAALLRKLLWQMQAQTRSPEPKQLGLIGKESFTGSMVGVFGCDPESVQCRKELGTSFGVPWVVEVGFGIRKPSRGGAIVAVGLNWAPALRLPFDSLSRAIQNARVDSEDPVVLAVHVVYPAACALDRGKTRYELPEALDCAVGKAVKDATKCWTKLKDKAARAASRSVTQRDIDSAQRKRSEKEETKRIAFEVMPEAYRIASAGAGLANARQVMYAARRLIIERTNNPEPWKDSAYFTQTLLPDYIATHPELTANWDVVFDNRGHFTEPHTDTTIDIGTVAVRKYVRGWRSGPTSGNVETFNLPHDFPTTGPKNRFRFALFIEKEGFHEHLTRAQIQERYDVALMSTKGMTVTSARTLIEQLSEDGVTTLVLHDFDKSGLNILHSTYTSGRRYKFKTKPKVIDLGLRLEDVQRLGLTGESVAYTKTKKDPREKLREYGASEAECDFLVRESTGSNSWAGVRVELNELVGEVFLRFIETKFAELGVQKVVPDAATLEAAYQRAARIASVQSAIRDAVEAANEEKAKPPDDFAARVSAMLKEFPSLAWDDAVHQIAAETIERDGEGGVE